MQCNGILRTNGKFKFIAAFYSKKCTTMINREETVEENSLFRKLRVKIRATGPITVAEYMKEALTNPKYGYYMRGNVFGREGDFTTAPEISQLFSEMIGVWFLNEWLKIGSPKPFHFVELGPGRGTLMSDITKVFHRFKMKDFSVHMIEASEALMKIQSQTLNCEMQAMIDGNKGDDLYYRKGITKFGNDVFWYYSLDDLKLKQFSLLVANEFFDTLPIHKLQKTERGWREVLIDCDGEDKFKYILSGGPTPVSQILKPEREDRNHIEVSLDAIVTAKKIAHQVYKYGGIALLIDYGHNGSKTDTFRAFRRHKQCDPLKDVGSCDLTADVDFEAIIKTVKDKCETFGPTTQRSFLTQMQIATRLQTLLQTCEDEELKTRLKTGYEMLTDEDKMGSVFKFVAIYPKILENFLKEYPPVGFLNENRMTDKNNFNSQKVSPTHDE